MSQSSSRRYRRALSSTRERVVPRLEAQKAADPVWARDVETAYALLREMKIDGSIYSPKEIELQQLKLDNLLKSKGFLKT